MIKKNCSIVNTMLRMSKQKANKQKEKIVFPKKNTSQF